MVNKNKNGLCIVHLENSSFFDNIYYTFCHNITQNGLNVLCPILMSHNPIMNYKVGSEKFIVSGCYKCNIFCFSLTIKTQTTK
jgi:hypothetical protein